MLAQGLFPGGREVVFTEGGIGGMVDATGRLIEEGISTIYEATFRHNGVLVPGPGQGL